MKVEITMEAYVEFVIDLSKFTPEFMKAFRSVFYPFWTIKDHLNHIGESLVRGDINHYNTYLEGYGDLKKNWGFKLLDSTLDPEDLDADEEIDLYQEEEEE